MLELLLRKSVKWVSYEESRVNEKCIYNGSGTIWEIYL